MATILFQQEFSSTNQILVKLSSSDLPAGSLTVGLGLTYTASQATFNSIKFSGSSSTSVSSNVIGSTGTVNITGSVFPSSGGTFATLTFDAKSSGTLNVDFSTLRINGVSATFVDPPSYAFTVVPLVETVSLKAGLSAAGQYDPFNSAFPSVSVKQQAEHGTVSLGEFFTSEWKYTSSSGYYGQDKFVLVSRDGTKTTEKTFIVDISPVGTSANDTFHSSKAAYTVDAGNGLDLMTYTGKRENYTISKSGDAFKVTDKTAIDGAQTLSNLERLKFSDSNVALDISGNAGKAYRLYQAAFDRTPDKGGLGFQMNALDVGASMQQIAQNFIDSPEFKSKYGTSLSNGDFVNQLYANVLHRAPDTGGYAYQVAALESGLTRSQLLINFSESPENYQATLVGIQNGIEYTSVA